MISCFFRRVVSKSRTFRSETVRNSCGVFDVSHMTVVDISGADATDFLRYLLANDVDKLKAPGKALYRGMLNADGGIIDDLITTNSEKSYKH